VKNTGFVAPDNSLEPPWPAHGRSIRQRSYSDIQTIGKTKQTTQTTKGELAKIESRLTEECNMRRDLMIATAIGFAMITGTSAQADVITYNSAPSDTFIYGSGNAYVPANSVVNTNDSNELALRFHQTGVQAPSAPNGVYTFALGTTPISFDWSIDGNADNSLITLLDIATGVTVSYNPFFPGNDNTNGGASDPDLWQNSERLNFSFLLGSDFDPMRNDTYQATLTANGRSVTAYAQLGSGAAVPEPATWAMMLFGFGGIGMAMRRSNKRKSSVLAQIA
jgi:hypothetical protein